MWLYPQPKVYEEYEGYFELPCAFVLVFAYGGDAEMLSVVRLFEEDYRRYSGCDCYIVPDYAGKLDVSVRLERDEHLLSEHYVITVGPEGVQIRFGTAEAAFRAMTTLLQMIESTCGKLPFCMIDDQPDIAHRGYLYDISRDRVPKLEEVFRMVDLLARLKYNELQLYLEQPAFEFAAYPEYASDIEALTPYDVLRIVEYCKRRYIRVVPNQNSFGHIHLWMIKPQLQHLAAMPDGYAVNPLNEETYQFLDHLYDSLLPCFDSPVFNVGCDEVSELERDGSRTQEACRQRGMSTVYLEHVLRLHQMLQSRGKRMMMWADILLHHPEVLSELPRDIIPMVWGYNFDTDLDTPAQTVAQAGFEFYVCPGTSSWASVLSDLEGARQNILHAVQACRKHGGIGVLLTDWGDVGSACFPVVSYQSIAWCGALSWSMDTNSDYQQAGEFVDRFVFRTRSRSLSQLIYQASSLMPKYCNCTDPVFSLLLPIEDFGVLERLSLEKVQQTFVDIANLEKQALRIQMDSPDAQQHLDEFCADVKAYVILLEMFEYKYELQLKGQIKNFDARIALLEQKIREAKVFYRRVWSVRWRITGWYGFWWFVDRQVNKLKRYCTGDSAYDILINDHKELGI